MGKRRYLLWTVCGLAILTSCDKGSEMPMPADDAIRFDNRFGESYVDNLTRGIVTNNKNLTEFGVFAYYAATGLTYDAATSKPDYMNNVHVTRPDGQWIYTPLKFWPQGSVSFFAYTPYANTEVSVACETGAPVITYAVPDDVTSHRDLMLSAPVLDRTNDKSAVTLAFSHALTCIDFNASVSKQIADQSIKVVSIRIGTFKNKASCNHEAGKAIVQTFSSDADDKEYTLSVDLGELQSLTLTEKSQQITSEKGYLMLWPQTIEDTDKLIVTAQYTANGEMREVVFERGIQQFVAETEAGKRYVFNLIFAPLADMTLTCKVAAWIPQDVNVPEFD